MSTLSKDALAMVIAVSVLGSPTTAADVPKHASAPTADPETVSSVDPARATVPDEERDFQRADKVGSLEGWRSFLSAHQSGVYAQLAKLEMERLVALDEERDFQSADKVGSLEGWRSFLSTHPRGVFAQLAKLEMEGLAAEKAAAPTGTKGSNVASAEDMTGGKGTTASPTLAEVASATSTVPNVSKHASAPTADPETVSSVDPARAAVPDEERDFQNADKVGSLEGWRSFLSAHPRGVFAQLAKLEMERLAAEKAAAPTGTKVSNVASAEDTTGGKGATASPTLAEVASATSAVPKVSKHASASTAHPETVGSVDPARATVPDEERDLQNAGVVESYEHAVVAYNVGEFAEAKRLWLPLAERGDAPAQLGLAVMYFLGQGVQRNMAAALDWCQKAADQGLAAAQYELGKFYEHPWRPELQNYPEAAKWYRKAADQNYAQAQDELGAIYEFGLGVPTNYTKAEEWFVKAGDLASVANMYDAVAHDPGKAANWKRKLADQGNKPARSHLGEMTRNGQRAQQDLLPPRCPEDGRECEKTGRRRDAIDLQGAKQGS